MPRPRSDIAPRIVEAARERFLEHGVDGASLRKIAADAGTNIGMIYYYFPTKDDLFSAVLEDVYGPFVSDFEAIMNDRGTLRERLIALSIRIGEMTAEEFAVMRIVIREGLVSGERLGQLAARFMRGHVPAVLSAIRQARKDGELRQDVGLPVVAMAIASTVLLPQLIRRRAIAGVPQAQRVLPTPATLGRGVIRLLFEGVRASGAEKT